MKTNEKGMMKLIADHALYSDKIRRLKKLGSEAFFKCERIQDTMSVSVTCIESAISDYKALMTDPTEFISFEEFFLVVVDEGSVCKHCLECRRLKKERAEAGRRLGQIRSAITKIGRRLQQEGDEK